MVSLSINSKSKKRTTCVDNGGREREQLPKSNNIRVQQQVKVPEAKQTAVTFSYSICELPLAREMV